MREAAGTEAAPSFDPLSAQLAKLDRVLRAQLACVPRRRADGRRRRAAGRRRRRVRSAPSGRARTRSARSTRSPSSSGSNEPSSPIPLFVERAKRLVSKDFLEVLADIAPDALAQARRRAG